MAVLSLNLPSRGGAEEPFATVTERLNSRPSRAVGPLVPSGFSKVATHSSPNVLAVPAGSSLDSEPANRRPCLSQASTGSPELAVRIWAREANGDVSPG